MPVYVGSERIKQKDYLLSFMVADTIEELHEMAEKVGASSVWFQQSGLGIPHYKLAQTLCKHAISCGATRVDSAGMAEVVERFKIKYHIR